MADELLGADINADRAQKAAREGERETTPTF